MGLLQTDIALRDLTRLFRHSLWIFLALSLFFLWQCSNQKENSSAPGPVESASPSNVPANRDSTGNPSDSKSDCVGTGCDGPGVVPGVQGCVGMGCDEPVKVPGVQGCAGMGCGKEDDSEGGKP